jgi:hypothetical protein
MSDRPEPRIQVELAVRVWGMGKDGHPFFQEAEARNISSEGALLSGLEQQLTAGDTIGVQYGDKKARFRVVWVIDAGATHKIQAGVQLLADQQIPWRRELTATPAVSPILPGSPTNKRKFPRLKVQIPIELTDERGATQMKTNATDMSGRGCYVETLLPAPPGTVLTATFWVASEKVSSITVVRTSDSGVGMGIEFIGLDEESQQRLQRALENSVPGIMGLGPKKR